MTESTADDHYSSLFHSLVYTFNMTAMQQLGKVINPLTRQKEKDAEQAQLTLEMLDMIKMKTKGNLSEIELDFLDHIRQQLYRIYDEEFPQA